MAVMTRIIGAKKGWHWEANEWEGKVTPKALYEGGRFVFELGCVDSSCHCSGQSPSPEDAQRIVDALNFAASQERVE